MFSTSVIEIKKSAIKRNLDYLRNQLKPGTTFSSVVKGNAYGHGIEHYVPLAYEAGVEHFSVFSAYEAYRVQKRLDGLPHTIMIMGEIENEALDWAIENGIEFFVFETDRLEKASEAAAKVGKKAKVHVEIETGMNRTGFATEEIKHLAGWLHNHEDTIYVKGICTHYAGAESIANHVRVQNQKMFFKDAIKLIAHCGIHPEQRHSCCSAAAIRMPEMHHDLVRIGILQYGFWPSKEILIEYQSKHKWGDDPLERIMSWKSRVMSVKKVKTGEFIGYGTTYLAQKDMTIAIVPVGYSHGFSRSLSNIGRALVRGKRMPVVGIVNMNSMALDVTDVPEVEKGDEVVMIGSQGALSLTVASFGELSEQLNYELLTRLPKDIPRKIV